MTSRFRLCEIKFHIVTKSKINPSVVLILLQDYFNFDTDDSVVSNDDLSIRFMTTEADAQILNNCDEVKKSLEQTTNGRLLYSIATISL